MSHRLIMRAVDAQVNSAVSLEYHIGICKNIAEAAKYDMPCRSKGVGAW
jgi:hypothetical protein